MNNMCSLLVFSKNRACQLELLLRSLGVPVTVLYTCDSEFKPGYKKLISMYPSVNFVLETNFKEQLIEIIKNSKYTTFFVDDDVMIRDFQDDNYIELEKFSNNPDIISLSLYLCKKYRRKNLPVFNENMWEWKPYRSRSRANPYRIWGHPMTVGSTIFRTADILPSILKNKINTPNYLEAAFNSDIPDRPLMLCFDEPKMVVNIANQVQRDFPSRTVGISLVELEHRFLKNERISLEDIKQKADKSDTYRLSTNYEYERF